MRILLTNDDGIFAEGLRCLERVARRLGEAITVVPDRERSGVSNAITLHQPLRMRRVAENRYVVDGTPTDCVWVAINHLLLDTPPDLVISGINHGPNLGHDVLYSGTVAGCIEGGMKGIPSMAMSFIGGPHWPWEAIEGWVEALIRRFVASPPPAAPHGALHGKLGPMMNVNIPNPGADGTGIRGLRITTLGLRHYSQEMMARTDPRGKRYVWIGGATVEHEDVPGSDCNAVHDGFVSVTPLQLDLTDRAAIPTLGAWEGGWPSAAATCPKETKP